MTEKNTPLNNGIVIELFGSAGSGKTRFHRELRRALRTRGLLVNELPVFDPNRPAVVRATRLLAVFSQLVRPPQVLLYAVALLVRIRPKHRRAALKAAKLLLGQAARIRYLKRRRRGISIIDHGMAQTLRQLRRRSRDRRGFATLGASLERVPIGDVVVQLQVDPATTRIRRIERGKAASSKRKSASGKPDKRARKLIAMLEPIAAKHRDPEALYGFAHTYNEKHLRRPLSEAQIRDCVNHLLAMEPRHTEQTHADQKQANGEFDPALVSALTARRDVLYLSVSNETPKDLEAGVSEVLKALNSGGPVRTDS